jgi:peptidoglycan/LPS O-acetylase OafA/YrhL
MHPARKGTVSAEFVTVAQLTQMPIEGRKELLAVDRVTGIDSARAIAALAVFVCHVSGYWLDAKYPLPGPGSGIFANGAHGVDLFIVVSGFCLALPFVSGASIQIGNFWLRRAMRLLPVYYTALIIASILATASFTSLYVVERPAEISDIALHALFLESTIPGRIGTINGSLWSVALEVQLYLLFPATLWLWRRLGSRRMLVATAAVSVVWSFSWNLGIGIVGSSYLLPARYVQFIAGMLVAELWATKRIPARRHSLMLLALGVVCGLAVATAQVHEVSPLIWTVPCAATLFLLLGSQSRVLRPLERFGIVTYSFYLLHQPILLVSSPLVMSISQNPYVLLLLGCSIGLGLTMAFAYPLYYLIERPSQAFGRRWRVTAQQHNCCRCNQDTSPSRMGC